MSMATLLKVLGVVLLPLLISIVILRNKDVPPAENPCKYCKNCKDCGQHCLTLNCTDCEETYIIPRSCIIAATIGAGITVPFTSTILGVIGFTSVGVTTGSLAALWQSTMAGIVAKGGIFATLQSLAAGGFSYYGTVLMSGAVGGGLYKFCDQVGSITGIDMKCYSQIKCK